MYLGFDAQEMQSSHSLTNHLVQLARTASHSGQVQGLVVLVVGALQELIYRGNVFVDNRGVAWESLSLRYRQTRL